MTEDQLGIKPLKQQPIVPKKRSDLDQKEYEERRFQKEDNTAWGQVKAVHAMTDFTIDAIRGMQNMMEDQEEGFSWKSPESMAKYKEAGYTGQEIMAFSGSKTSNSVDRRIEQIADDKLNARIVEDMGVMKTMAIGLPMLLASPTAIGSVYMTNRMIGFFGARAMLKATKTGTRFRAPAEYNVGRGGATVTNAEKMKYSSWQEAVGSAGVVASAEFGMIEATRANIGDRNYEALPISLATGFFLGAGLTGLLTMATKVGGGVSPRTFIDMLDGVDIDSNMPVVFGPASGSTAKLNAKDVIDAQRGERKVLKIMQPTLFTPDKQAYHFNLRKTPEQKQWSTKDNGRKPLVEPGAYIFKTTRQTEIAEIITKNVESYKKPLTDRQKVSVSVSGKKKISDHASAEKELKRVSKAVAKNSKGRYDSTNLANDVIRESLPESTAIKSSGEKGSLSKNPTTGEIIGRQKGRPNLVPDKIFIESTKSAERLARGEGTPADIRLLADRIERRDQILRDLYEEDLHMRGEKPPIENGEFGLVAGKPTAKVKIVKEPLEQIRVRRWEEAPANMQPGGKGSRSEEIKVFDDEYIEKATNDDYASNPGKPVNEVDVHNNQGRLPPKEINIVRSKLSQWAGAITNTRFTGSIATILINRVASGKTSKEAALLVSKFVTPIYTITDGLGNNLAAKINSTDIRHSLEVVFGYNQKIKFDAYTDYLRWYAQSADKTKNPKAFTLAEFDAHISTQYSHANGRFEEVAFNKAREIRKDTDYVDSLREKEKARLNETENIQSMGKDENGAPVADVELRIKHERMRKATENLTAAKPIHGMKTPDELIEEAVDNIIKHEAEARVNVQKDVYDTIPEIRDAPHVVKTIEADRGYYQYHGRRALENGLDSEGTWSKVFYIPRSVNKGAIIGKEDYAKEVFAQSIRTHEVFKQTLDDFVEETAVKFAGSGKSTPKEMTYYVGKMKESVAELNNILSNSKDYTNDTAFINEAEKFNRYARYIMGDEDAGAIKREAISILSHPGKAAGEIVKGAETATKLRDNTFNINSIKGAPNFLKRRHLAMNTRVEGYGEFMNLGSQKNMAAYDYKMKGETSVQELFGTRDVEEFIEEVSAKYNLKIEDEGMFRNMFETAKGEKQIADDPNAWGESLTRIANAYTYLAMGGGFIKYAISEMGVSTAKNGFRNTMREIPYAYDTLKDMYRLSKTGKLDFSDPNIRDMMAFADIYELYGRRLKSAFTDGSEADALASTFANNSWLGKTDKKMHHLQQGYFKWTGLEGATMFTKMVAGRAMMRRISDIAVTGREMDRDLFRMGFTQSDMNKLKSELLRVGYTGKGQADFSFHKWTDPEFAASIKRKINRVNQETILRNEDLHKPLWTSDGKIAPLFKLTRLFSSFQFMSQERLLMTGLTDSPAKTMAGMGTTATLLGFSYAISEILEVQAGNKKYEDAVLPWGENSGKFYRQLVIMGSYTGTFGTALSTAGFRNLDGGAFAGKFNVGANDMTKVAGGAPVNKALQMGKTMLFNPLSDDSVDQARWNKDLKSSIMTNNHWMMNTFWNTVARKAAGE